MTADPYAAIAGVYDPVTHRFLRGPRKAALDVCVELGVRRVLDIGCGTGAFSYLCAEKGIRVLGVDVSSAMLHVAAKRGEAPAFLRAPCESPVFFRADAKRLPFVPGAADLAVYCLLLHEQADVAETLLDQGLQCTGRVLVLEWRMPERNLDYARTFWVHGIERLAGKEHYRQFRLFMRQGGLNGLARRVGARLVMEREMKGGSVVLAVLERQNRHSPCSAAVGERDTVVPCG